LLPAKKVRLTKILIALSSFDRPCFIGEFDTGTIANQLLFGVDWAQYDLQSDSFTSFASPFRTPINIFERNRATVPRPDLPDEPTRNETINADRLLVYLQNQIEVTDELTLVGGNCPCSISNPTITTKLGGTNLEFPQ